MTELLTTIAVIFIVAGPFLLLANYFRLPTAPALIAAGLTIGPVVDLVVGPVIDPELKLEIARLGIALLVFTFAIRIHTTDAQSVVGDSEVVALGQICILGALGFGAGLLFSLPPEQAIYLGIGAAISSSIVGSSLFLPGDLDLIHDRLSESIHAVQDFIGLFLLLLISAGTFMIDPIATQIGYGVMLILAAIAINRYLFHLISRFAGGAGEAMLIGTIALLLIFLGAAEFFGVSIVVGAFAAGIAVHHDPVKHRSVINGIDSMNDFFAAIFFITIGALVTLPSIDVIWMTVALVFLVGVVKPALSIIFLMYKGYERRTATLTGFNLDQVGEFSLIIAIEALILGIILDTVFEAIILAAAITLVTSSFTRYYDEEIYRVLADSGLLGRYGQTVERRSSVPDGISDHVVIIGYGHHGQRLVEACETHNQSYVTFESNPDLTDELQSDCEAYVIGDVIEPRADEIANLSAARLVISTADTRPVNEHVVSFSDQVDVIVRAQNRANAKQFLDNGALYATVSDLLAANRLEEHLEGLLENEYDREELRNFSFNE